MTKRYGDPILVAHQNDQIRCFIWRGTTYHVKAVLATWHLRDRWWEGRIRGHTTTQTAIESDRHYYRLDCSPELLCDVYFDASTNVWILDRIYD